MVKRKSRLADELLKERIKDEILERLVDQPVNLHELETQIDPDYSHISCIIAAERELERQGYIEIIRDGHPPPFTCWKCMIKKSSRVKHH